MSKHLKEAHSYHEAELTIEHRVWMNCPYCRRVMCITMYGEKLDHDDIIQCRNCNKNFTLGVKKRDAKRNE